jgi:pantoate--beta-alanine ligase
LELVTTRSAWRSLLESQRRAGHKVGLVPTMGALHAGHLSLIEAAAARTGFVAMTLFVNPLQFGEAEDLAHYPRDLAADLRLAERHGAAAVFAPDVEEMYGGGAPPTRVVPGPLASLLEGASRPGHFEGVATVVTKLFSLAGPSTAFFGEKDYQQLVIVRQIAADLDLPVEVVGCPIVREPDGLAMSSRNRRLAVRERAAATVLHRALLAGREVIESGGDPSAAEAAMHSVLGSEPLVEPDYAAVVDAASLGGPVRGAALRLLVAATVGPVRLIDNMAAGPAPAGAAAAAIS